MAGRQRDPLNIFEAVSRSEKERKEKAIEEKRRLTSPPPTAFEEAFARCRNIHEDLSSWIDSAFRQGGVSPKKYSQYISESQNFSKRDWELVQEQRQENEKMLKTLLEQKPLPPPQQTSAAEEKEKTESSTKKPRVVTRRRWIGMR